MRADLRTWAIIIASVVGRATLGVLLVAILIAPVRGVAEASESGEQQADNVVDPDLLATVDGAISETVGSVAHIVAHYPVVVKRIQDQIRELETEFLEESLALLWQISMFEYPGSSHRAQMLFVLFPLRARVGSEDVDVVMSNRRFLKVLQELASLPKTQAASLVATQIEHNLAWYREHYEEKVMMSHPGFYDPEAHIIGGLSFTWSDSTDGTPRFQGVRYSLWALVLIAGNLGLTDARDAVLEVAGEALAQREMFYGYQENGINKSLAHQALADAGLYNRQILAAGLIGTGGPSQSGREAVAASGYKTSRKRLTAYNAFTTPYDDEDIQIPPDYSKGEFTVHFLYDVSDEDFDAIFASR